MRIVVIGAGFVGRPLVERLEGDGHEVFAVTLNGGGGTLACDVSDPEAVAALAAEVGLVDAAVHCASSGRGGDRLARYRAVYLEGCRNVIGKLRPGRLVFASSSSVYGQTDGSVVDEQSATEPPTGTSRVLLDVEAAVRAAGGSVARLAGLYGPGRSYLLKRYLEGGAQIDGDEPGAAGRWINQLHRDDAAATLAHLLEAEPGIYNAADDTPLTQRACYVEFDRRFGKGVPDVAPPETGRARGWSDKRVSNAKLRATGWTPRFPSYFDALDNDPELLPSIESQL